MFSFQTIFRVTRSFFFSRRFSHSQNGESCANFLTGNVAAGVAIGVAGFAAGIGMVAFAEAQVSTCEELGSITDFHTDH